MLLYSEGNNCFDEELKPDGSSSQELLLHLLLLLQKELLFILSAKFSSRGVSRNM